MLYALYDETGESERQRLHTGCEAEAEDVTFDVIPGRNSDGAVAAGTCQLVRQSFDAKQKLYMTSARLEKGRNTAQLDVGRYPASRVRCIFVYLVS